MALKAETYREDISEAVMQSSYAQQFLSPGRVVIIKSQVVSGRYIISEAKFFILL